MRTYPHVTGYAILITNDHLYWNPSEKKDSVDKDFRLHNGRLLSETFQWSEHAGIGTTSGREEPLVLTGEYLLEWQPYSSVDVKRNGEFKALVVHVDSL